MKLFKFFPFLIVFLFLAFLALVNAENVGAFINLNNYYDFYNATPATNYNFSSNSSFLEIYTLPSVFRTKILYFFYNLTNAGTLNNLEYLIFNFTVKNKILQSGYYGDRIRTQVSITSSEYIGKDCQWQNTHYECYPRYNDSTIITTYDLLEDIYYLGGYLLLSTALFNGTVYNSTALYGFADDGMFHNYSIMMNFKDNRTYLLVDNQIKLIAKIYYLPKYLQLSSWGWDYNDITLHQFKDFYIYIEKCEIPLLQIINTTSNISINDTIITNLLIFNDTHPLTNLTYENFTLSLGEYELPIENFINYNNGYYQISSRAFSNKLGTQTLKVKLSYENETIENSTQIFIKTPIKDKILFIANSDWKTILSLTPTKKPILITNSIDSSISHFIDVYKSDQVFQFEDVTGNIISYENYKLSSFGDIPKLFFNTNEGIYAGNEKQKAKVASILASLLNKPLVFNSSDALLGYNLSNNSIEEIENIYFQKIKENNNNINYLAVSDESTVLDAVITSQKNGFILQTNSSNTTEIFKGLKSTIDKLNANGFFINNTNYILNGAYLLMLGSVPMVQREDPVERGKFLGIWTFNDSLDGDKFYTDLDYGDLDNDTYLDVAVGRLPNNDTTASLMFTRELLPDNKNALTASEYLHTNWLSILLYGGGGMWQGRTISKILEDEGYNVTRLVEHRSEDPRYFLQQFNPTNVKSFLDQTKSIGKLVTKYLGKTIGSIVSKALIVLKSLQYVEQGLEMYLEYDWSTFGPKYERAMEFIKSLDSNNLLSFDNAAEIINILWPYPWGELNQVNLANVLKDKDIIYYEGIGNGSTWILPNSIEMSGFLGWKQFLENRYNGSEVFLPENISLSRMKLVWDNSDLSATGNSSIKDAFLERSAANFIGASAINYIPFSSEIDTRFFRDGRTSGMSLIKAINDFRDDSFTWDPFSIIRPGIKAKTLREFVLYGDPSLPKDPVIEKQNYTQNVFCDNNVCTLNVSIPASYEIVESENETTIATDAENFLLEEFKPIIPLKEFEYFLPSGVELLEEPQVTTADVAFYNISLPKVSLLSHSLINISQENTSSVLCPEEPFKLMINSTIDNRTRVKLIVPIIRYNESNKTALVATWINLTLKYKVPIEFSISAQDVPYGENTTIFVKIWSDSKENSTLYLQISNSTYTSLTESYISLNEGENDFEFNYTPENIGNFLVEGLLVSGNMKIGPRKTVFSSLDIESPRWLKIEKTPLNLTFSTQNVTIETDWKDNVGVDTVMLFYKFNDSLEDSGYTSKQMWYLDGNTYQVNLTFDLSNSAGQTFWYYIFANDTNNNSNMTLEYGDYIEGMIKPIFYKFIGINGQAELNYFPNFSSTSNILIADISNNGLSSNGKGFLLIHGFEKIYKKSCFFHWCENKMQKQPVTAYVEFSIASCMYFTENKTYCTGQGNIKFFEPPAKTRLKENLDKINIKIEGSSGEIEGFKNFESIFNVTGMRIIRHEIKR